MIQEDIKFLKALLQKAKNNGYANLALINIKITKEYIITNQYFQLIFDVDFAKAIWGEKDRFGGRIKNYSLPQWQYKQWGLATVKDPLEYLKQEAICLKP